MSCPTPTALQKGGYKKKKDETRLTIIAADRQAGLRVGRAFSKPFVQQFSVLLIVSPTAAYLLLFTNTLLIR